jgi:ATP-dependent Clp protease ATP-binding subunit ClpB
MLSQENLTDKSLEVLQAAQEAARNFANSEVAPIHLAKALVEAQDSLLNSVIVKAGGNAEAFGRKVTSVLSRLPSQDPAPTETPSFGRAAIGVLNGADDLRKRQHDTHLAIDHLITALLADGDVIKAIEAAGTTPKAITNTLAQVRGSRRVDSKSGDATYEALSKYAIDLIAMAKEGKLDPCIGRDDEIRRVIRVLARRTKNNPILVGEPGVGKTAIAEGLAQRILRKDVPQSLDAKLYSLDMGALIAGGMFC